jgi:lipoate-protein ligase A
MVQSFVLKTTDPWGNLAVEEALFGALAPGDLTLVLYVNSACVVLGKHQNPVRELRFEALKARQIPVVRRHSGGGTVFHDTGNLNYSFLASSSLFDKTAFLTLVADTLAQLGREVVLTDKGDLLLGGAKVSGTASQLTRARSMVHGTLLCEADLASLHGVLGPTGTLEAFVGVASRPSPVANLELPVTEVADALVRHFHERYGGEPSMRQLSASSDSLRSPQWTWDRTPPFTWSGPTRLGALRVRVEDGVIVEDLTQRDDEAQNLIRIVGKRFFSPELFDLFD